jgi:uncharacterized protein YndB with AHSA1/START domain
VIFTAMERIEAPAPLVWKHLTDPELMGEWMPGIESIRARDEAPLDVGSKLIFTTHGSEKTSEVVDFMPGERIALRSRQGPVTATYRYGLRPRGDGAIVAVEADSVATGPGKLIAPLIRALIRRTDSGQLKALKEVVEKAEASSAGPS